jgi:phenylalanine-4-hydroxylase
MAELPMASDQIPDFRRLSDVLYARTSWEIVAVPGLVPDDVFFEHWANRRFPAGNFIRQPHELDYLKEPDVFHDVFGHVPMLMHPVLADFIQAYGAGGLRAQALGRLAQLARVAYLWRRHCVLRNRERVCTGISLAQPAGLYAGAGDAHALPH